MPSLTCEAAVPKRRRVEALASLMLVLDELVDGDAFELRRLEESFGDPRQRPAVLGTRGAATEAEAQEDRLRVSATKLQEALDAAAVAAVRLEARVAGEPGNRAKEFFRYEEC